MLASNSRVIHRVQQQNLPTQPKRLPCGRWVSLLATLEDRKKRTLVHRAPLSSNLNRLIERAGALLGLGLIGSLDLKMREQTLY